jgi:ribonuclease HI
VVVNLYVDGGTRGSVICLVDPQRNKTIVKKRKGDFTNNDLEYLAAIYGIEYAKKYYPRDTIIIRTDSMLVVKQINNTWYVNGPNLRTLHSKTLRKLNSHIRLKWVPREINLAGIHLEQIKDRL